MRNIVIGYDGSEAARRALERVAELARDDTEVTIVSVPPVTFTSLGPMAPAPEVVADHERRLAEARDLLVARGVQTRTVDTVGLPAEVIVEVAKETDADLVVVGTGDKNIAERLVLGSVSSKVVSHAPCDVLVVR